MIGNLKQGQYFGNEIAKKDDSHFFCNLTHYEPFQLIEDHYHENGYLSLLISGNYIERNDGEEKEIGPGNVLFRPAHYRHANHFITESAICFNIELKPATLEKMDSPVLPGKRMIYSTGNLCSVYKLAAHFYRNIHADLYFELLLDCLSEMNENIPAETSLPWIDKVLRILENELDVFHSLQSISNRVFVHPVYMARAFKKNTGLTIGEYQIKIRLKKAKELLFTTDDTIWDIALKSGFYDAAHFIKSYKLVYGLTPFQFRASLRKSI